MKSFVVIYPSTLFWYSEQPITSIFLIFTFSLSVVWAFLPLFFNELKSLQLPQLHSAIGQTCHWPIHSLPFPSSDLWSVSKSEMEYRFWGLKSIFHWTQLAKYFWEQPTGWNQSNTYKTKLSPDVWQLRSIKTQSITRQILNLAINPHELI